MTGAIRWLAPRAAAGLLLAWLAGLPDWEWLCLGLLHGTVALCRAMGLEAAVQEGLLYAVAGKTFEMSPGCTQLPYLAGLIPVLVDVRAGLRRNAARVAAAFGLLCVLNLARLGATFGVWAWGASWELSHDVFSGVTHSLVIAAGMLLAERGLEKAKSRAA